MQEGHENQRMASDSKRQLLDEVQELAGTSESRFAAELPGVRLWSAEEPNLYRLLLVAEDADRKSVV